MTIDANFLYKMKPLRPKTYMKGCRWHLGVYEHQTKNKGCKHAQTSQLGYLWQRITLYGHMNTDRTVDSNRTFHYNKHSSYLDSCSRSLHSHQMPEQLEAHKTVPKQSAPSGTFRRQNTTSGITALSTRASGLKANGMYETSFGLYEFGYKLH